MPGYALYFTGTRFLGVVYYMCILVIFHPLMHILVESNYVSFFSSIKCMFLMHMYSLYTRYLEACSW